MYFLSKLFFSIIRLFSPDKVINFPIGWDTLSSCAPYSYGGVPRKKFLVLFRRKKIETDDYYVARYGSVNPSWEKVVRSIERGNRMKKLF